MAPSVSGAFALIGFAVLAATGSMYIVFFNTGERVSGALDEHGADIIEQGQTDINITAIGYDGTVLVVNVTNSGDTRLSVNRTDLLIDGQYIPTSTSRLD